MPDETSNINFNINVSGAQAAAIMKGVSKALLDAESAAKKLSGTISQLGITWDTRLTRGMGGWRDTSGRIVSGMEAVRRATAAATQVANQLGVSFQQASPRVQRAILAVVSAQTNLTKVTNQVNDALKKQAMGSGDATEIINKHALAQLRLTKAQQDLNQQLKSEEAAKQAAQIEQMRNAASTAISVIGNLGGKVLALVGAFVIGKVAIGGFNLVLGALKSVIATLTSPITKTIDWLHRLFDTAAAVAFGVIIRDTVRNIIRELRDMVVAGLDAVITFQKLQIRLEQFASREVLIKGVGNAMQETTKLAKGLLDWVKKLSLTVPFSTETLANTLSLNMAMGFTSNQARELTTAIAAYTAGMGLSNEVMERIVFNFGQMKQAGKVTGTELRDLARGAFFPLNDILGEAANLLGLAGGKLTEFRKLAAEGAIDINTFFQAFINVVGKNFGDALEKFGRTIEGVRIRFGNFIKTVVGLEMLGPLFDRIAEQASFALDKLLSPETLEKARLIGFALEQAFISISTAIRNVFLPAIGNVLKALGIVAPSAEQVAFAIMFVADFIGQGIRRIGHFISSMSQMIAETLSGLAGKAGEWGFNIIAFLAKGMAAAARLIVQVITAIANIIASLLRAGSPPKILPDLPEWGMKAMAEYLHGFTQADFDVLEGIQGPLEDALSILVETGKLGEKAAAELFVGISKDWAKALSEGFIPEDLFEQIRKAGGPFGEEIAILAARQVELAGANEKVRASEELLNLARKKVLETEERLALARKKEIEAFSEVRSQVSEYNALLRAGSNRQMLAGKLAQINAAEDATKAAQNETKAAEEAVEAAKKAADAAAADLAAKQALLDFMKDQVRLQEQLVAQLLKLSKMLIIQPEQPEAPGAGAGAGGGLGDIAEGIQDIFAGLDTAIEGFDEEALKKKIEAMFDEAHKAAGKKLDELEALLREKWKKILAVFGVPTGVGKDKQASGLAKSLTDLWNTILVWWETNGPAITAAVTLVAAAFLVAGSVILDAWGKFGPTIMGEGLDIGVWDLFGITLGTTAILIALSFGIVAAAIEGVLSVAATAMIIFNQFADAIDRVIIGIMTSFVGIALLVGSLADLLAGADPSTFKDKILAGWEGLKTGVLDIWNGLWTAIVIAIGAPIIEILALILGFADGIISFIQGMKDKIVTKSIIPEMMEEMLTVITEKLNAIKKIFEDIWNGLVYFLENTIAKAMSDFVNNVLEPVRVFLAINLTGAIMELINGAFTDLKNIVEDELTTALNNLKNNVLKPLKLGFDEVSNAVLRLIGLIDKLITSLNLVPWDKLKLIANQSPSPLATGFEDTTDEMRKMVAALPLLSSRLNALSAPMVAAPVAARAAFAGGGVSVNMGGVSISNGMDEAVFEAAVTRAIRKGMRG